jgi:hypothetical protein
MFRRSASGRVVANMTHRLGLIVALRQLLPTAILTPHSPSPPPHRVAQRAAQAENKRRKEAKEWAKKEREVPLSPVLCFRAVRSIFHSDLDPINQAPPASNELGASPLRWVGIEAGGVQELNMAVLASLLDHFGLESSKYMVCFNRLGVRRIEVHALPHIIYRV